MSLIGSRWSEPELLGLAYDLEQATHVRVKPTFLAHETSAVASAQAATRERVTVVPSRNGHWRMAPNR